MNSAGPTYGLSILEICFKALEFGDEYTNRNIGFCVGMVIEFGKEKIYEHYGAIMQKLKEILENSTLQDTRDNAMSALGRMIYTNPSLVPLEVVRKIYQMDFLLEQVVPGIVKEMPLRGDPKEERTLVKMLVFLFETSKLKN